MKTPLSRLKHQPKATPPNAIILGVKISTYKFGDTKSQDPRHLPTSFPVSSLAFLQPGHSTARVIIKKVYDLCSVPKRLPISLTAKAHSPCNGSQTHMTWSVSSLISSPSLYLLQSHCPPCFVLYSFFIYCRQVCILDISVSYNLSARNVFLSNVCKAHSLTFFKFLLKRCKNVVFTVNHDYHV